MMTSLFCFAQNPVWPEPTQESKPWTRWRWMENAVDKENIKRELKAVSYTHLTLPTSDLV